MPCLSGRGHRPCQSAALGSGPAGGHSPRPAPDPPPAGAGLSWCLDRPIYRAPCRAGGGNAGRVSFSRPNIWRKRCHLPPGYPAKALSPLHWQGPSPLPQRCAGIRTGRGPQPPASARPAPGGRFAPAGPGAGLRSTCGKGPHAAVVPDRAGKPAVIRGRPGRASRLCGGSAGCSPAASGGDAFQNPVDGTRASAGPGRAGPGQP